MSGRKMQWFRFFISRWREGVFELKPIERYVYLEMLCELYNEGGHTKLDTGVMARRCGMRPSSFQKALDTLVAKGKINIERGFFTNRAVVEEIINREKLAQKSKETRQKLPEKPNDYNRKPRFVPPYTENRIKKEIEDVSELGGEDYQPSADLIRIESARKKRGIR